MSARLRRTGWRRWGVVAMMACAACSSAERTPDPPLPVDDAPPPAPPRADPDPSDLAPVAAPLDDGGPRSAADAAGGADLWVTSAPTCTTPGEVGAVFRGVPVYCQVSSTTGYYQCDELANRFLRDATGHPNIDNVVTEYASSMCATAAGMTSYAVYGAGYRPPSGASPLPGDVLVWPGLPGHAAVVTSAAAGVVSYVQQNNGRPADVLAWNGKDPWPTACWIHPLPSTTPTTPAPTAPSCGCFDGDGDYCGLSIVNHAAWYRCAPDVAGGKADYQHLYTCQNGRFTAAKTCASCVTALLTNAKGVCNDP